MVSLVRAIGVVALALSPGAAGAGGSGADLRRAVHDRDAALVERLLAGGARPDSGDFNETTPLFEALTGRTGAENVPCSPEIARLLLKAGADPNLARGVKIAPLAGAVGTCPAAVADLLAAGADVNASRGAFGRLPLHFAVEAGDLGLVRELLERGARTDAADESGRAPLALARSSAVIAALLDAGAGVGAGEGPGRSPLDHLDMGLVLELARARPAIFEELFAALSSADPSVRLRGARIMESFAGEPRVEAALARAARSDADEEVRARAAEALQAELVRLESAGGPGAVGMALRLIDIPDLAGTAARVLAASGGAAGKAALRPYLFGSDYSRYAVSVNALLQMGDHRYVRLARTMRARLELLALLCLGAAAWRRESDRKAFPARLRLAAGAAALSGSLAGLGAMAVILATSKGGGEYYGLGVMASSLILASYAAPLAAVSALVSVKPWGRAWTALASSAALFVAAPMAGHALAWPGPGERLKSLGWAHAGAALAVLAGVWFVEAALRRGAGRFGAFRSDALSLPSYALLLATLLAPFALPPALLRALTDAAARLGGF